MNDESLDGVEDRLLVQLSETARGPRRNAVFALWLIVHVAGGVLRPYRVSERNHARRLQRLERRLSSLSLPPPLRRALATALSELAVGTSFAASVALYQLVPAARETVGVEAGEAISLAAKRAKEAGSGLPL